MKKIALILAVLMLTAFCIIPTSATDPVNVIGYSSQRVEKPATVAEAHNIFNYLHYYEDEFFFVNSAQGLVELSRIVKEEFETFNGKTIYITKDIDMTGVVWEPIGINTTDGAFKGTIDGLGHVIDNLVYTSDAPGGNNGLWAGGFVAYAQGATFKNLVLGAGCSFGYTGASGDARLAAFVGTTWGLESGRSLTFDNCYNLATVTTVGKFASAFVGQYYSGNQGGKLVIKNCTNAGDITGKMAVGGFISYTAGALEIDNCRNTGAIELDNTSAKVSDYHIAAGGFVGRGVTDGNKSRIDIKNSVNNGAVTATNIAGGITGTLHCGTFMVDKCTNYGTITASTAGEIAATCVPDSGAALTQLTDCVEKAGQTDDTLSTVEQIVFDSVTDDSPNEPIITEDDNTPTTPENNPTTTPDGTTAPDKEDTSDTESETAADNGETTEETEERGCKSAVGAGALVVMAVVGGAAVITKKRR